MAHRNGNMQEERYSAGDRVAIPGRGHGVAIPGRGHGVVVEVLERAVDCDGQMRTPYRVELDSGGEYIGHPDAMLPLDGHYEAMIAAGWIAERDLFGNVEWQDPNAGWHRWSDDEARLHYQAGDVPSAPRIREPQPSSNGHKEAASP